MDVCLIISRFDEDLDWLKKYSNYKVIIYNKGNEINYDYFKNIIKLENVGRESHTWLHHIVSNYNNLNEINIFLQGRIDDLGCMVYKDLEQYIRKIDRFGFSASRYGLLGPLHWSRNVGIENDKRYKKAWINKEISRSEIGFRKFSKNILPDIPYFVSTSYGGCFAVKKEKIYRHNIEFYKYLLNILNKNKNPIEGHYLERLWCYIFTKNATIYQSYFDILLTKFEKLLPY